MFKYKIYLIQITRIVFLKVSGVMFYMHRYKKKNICW